MQQHYRYSPAAPTTATGRLRCPCCHGTLQREPRRLLDRLLSLFVPMRRYRCYAITCGWEGALRDRGLGQSRSGNTKRYQTRINQI